MKNYPCALCNSVDQSHAFGQVDKYRQSVSLAVCNRCGLQQLNPRMTEDELARFYTSEYYALYGMDEKKATLPHWVRRKRDIAHGILDAIEGHRSLHHLKLLDVGCGHGFLLEEALRRKAKVFGIEPSVKQAEELRDRGFEVAACELEDFLSDGAQGFDVITLSHVLEHVSDPQAFLGHVRQLLNPDGLLCVEVPNVTWQGLYGRHPLSTHSAHLHYYSEETLCAMLAICGLNPVSVSFGLQGGSVRVVCVRSEPKNLSDFDLPFHDPDVLLTQIRLALRRLNPPLLQRVANRTRRDWNRVLTVFRSLA